MTKKILFLALFIFTVKVLAGENQETTPATTPIPITIQKVDLYLTGEFLWWKGIQEGLNYATTGVLVQPGTTISSGKVHSVDYPWKPGFRVGLGFYPGHDGWDLYARYTYFHSSSTARAQNSAGNMLPITVTLSGVTNVQIQGVTSARSSWHLHYNVVDLELGKALYLSRFLSIRLFAGLRGTWTDQDWNTHYRSNQITFGGGGALPGTITTRQTQDNWGIGLRMGANGNWIFYKGWSIVSDISFAGVWVDYDVTRRDRITQTGVASASTANIKSTPDTAIVNIDLMLGLKGSWWFKNERYHLSLQVGWENQTWINYGQFIFLTGSNNGDLTFTGLTTRLRFDF